MLKQVIHYPETNSVEATWVNGLGVNTRCVSYSDRQMAELSSELGEDLENYASLITEVVSLQKPIAPTLITIPPSLTMSQARIALLNAGLLDTVEAGIAQLPRAAQIKWEFAATVDRSDSLTQALAAALGLTEPQLDALFTAGAVL